MKSIIFSCLFAVAMCRPQSYSDSVRSDQDPIEILRDDRLHPEGGSYSFDFETENGIQRSESGARLDIDEEPTGQQGSFSFPLPNGEQFELKFVADENGFQ